MTCKNKNAAGGNQTAYLYSLQDGKIIQFQCQETLYSMIKERGEIGIRHLELLQGNITRPFSSFQIAQALEELENQNLIKAEKRYPHKGRPSIWVIAI